MTADTNVLKYEDVVCMCALYQCISVSTLGRYCACVRTAYTNNTRVAFTRATRLAWYRNYLVTSLARRLYGCMRCCLRLDAFETLLILLGGQNGVWRLGFQLRFFLLLILVSVSWYIWYGVLLLTLMVVEIFGIKFALHVSLIDFRFFCIMSDL